MRKIFYTYDDHLKESLNDPVFKKLWRKSEPEYLLADSLIKARIEKKVSQKDPCKKT